MSYIVRSIHELLKDRFAKAGGLAGDSVTVLDPASGTLTFLAEASKLAVNEFVEKIGDGYRQGFIVKDRVTTASLKSNMIKRNAAFTLTKINITRELRKPSGNNGSAGIKSVTNG